MDFWMYYHDRFWLYNINNCTNCTGFDSNICVNNLYCKKDKDNKCIPKKQIKDRAICLTLFGIVGTVLGILWYVAMIGGLDSRTPEHNRIFL